MDDPKVQHLGTGRIGGWRRGEPSREELGTPPVAGGKLGPAGRGPDVGLECQPGSTALPLWALGRHHHQVTLFVLARLVCVRRELIQRTQIAWAEVMKAGPRCQAATRTDFQHMATSFRDSHRSSLRRGTQEKDQTSCHFEPFHLFGRF